MTLQYRLLKPFLYWKPIYSVETIGMWQLKSLWGVVYAEVYCDKRVQLHGRTFGKFYTQAHAASFVETALSQNKNFPFKTNGTAENKHNA